MSLLACSMFACQPYPTRPVVTDVDLDESGPRSDVDEDDVLKGLATAESPKFLLLFRGVAVDYEVYDPNVLAKDLERIERYYRARGYYEAKVTAARVLHLDRKRPKVRVEIAIDPGRQVKVRSVQPKGFAELPFKVSTRATRAIELKPGDAFDEDRFNENKQALARVLADNGFAFAKVDARARVDISQHSADLEYIVVDKGPSSRFGRVRIIGLNEIPEDKVRDNLGIEPGRAYSKSELEDAEKALIELGVFSTVEIQEDRSQPETGIVPINVIVNESRLRTIRLGGGSTLDVLRATTHVRTGWEDRNFLGGMRRFSIDAKPGFTWYPISLSRLESIGSDKIKPFFEPSVRAELHQPSFIEGRTTGFVTGEYRLYSLLYPLPEPAYEGDTTVEPEEQRIIGFHSVRASTGVSRAFFGHHVFVRPSYNWQANFPMVFQSPKSTFTGSSDTQGSAAIKLETVRVSFPELVTTLDLRDDVLNTRNGIFLSNTLQVAGGPRVAYGRLFGGTISDIRVEPEIRAYKELSRRFTLATRLKFGFLFPQDYGESLEAEAFDPNQPEVVRDQQYLLFRAFYSGGPSSNRGYPYRAVGPHGPIGFLLPTGLDCRLIRSDPRNPTGDPIRVPLENLPAGCTRPLGGVTMWEASLEVRAAVTGPLHATFFIDASDVTREIAMIRLNVPHVSPGLGLRYMTPVGPLRLDVGYRFPGLQKLGEDELPQEEGRVSDLLGVLPIAVHIAIGEAF